MINISEDFKLAYRNFSGVHTKLQIGSTLFSEGSIVEGSLALTESVCSGEEINLKSVEKSSLAVSLFTDNTTADLKGKSAVVYQECDGESETLPLGVFIIDDARRRGSEVALRAYDKMTLFDQDVSAWYSGLTFPVTVKDMITSLAAYVGVSTALPTAWTNSAFQIQDWNPGEITGTAVISYLQEVSAGFFRCNRTGSLTFVSIDVSTTARAFQPQDIEEGSAEIADYTCETIDKLQIITASDRSSDITIGTGDNVYVIDNPMLYGLTDQTVATAIYNALAAITYTPLKADLTETYPWVEVGDTVSIETYDGETATAPLLKRSLSGAKLCRGSIESHGLALRSQGMPLSERMADNYNSLDSRVTALENGGGGGGMAEGIEGYEEVWIRNYHRMGTTGKKLSGFIHMLYSSASEILEAGISSQGLSNLVGFLIKKTSYGLRILLGESKSKGDCGVIYEDDGNGNGNITIQHVEQIDSTVGRSTDFLRMRSGSNFTLGSETKDIDTGDMRRQTYAKFNAGFLDVVTEDATGTSTKKIRTRVNAQTSTVQITGPNWTIQINDTGKMDITMPGGVYVNGTQIG